MNAKFFEETFANEKLASRIDEVSDNLIYFGTALPSCESDDDNKWQIKVMVKTGTISSFGYPNGDDGYNYNWNNRSSYSYKINKNFTDTL